MSNNTEINEKLKTIPGHLWQAQCGRKSHYYSKKYIDTTKCFETMFSPRSSVQNGESIMMISHHSKSPSDNNSFLPYEQNTSDENVPGSKYLLVPPGAGPHLAIGCPPHHPSHPNTHLLNHQSSLPNHHVGYRQGSVTERSSSIITEHSGTSETPPMTRGRHKRLIVTKCY